MKWLDVFDWWRHKEQKQEAEESRERLDETIGRAQHSTQRLQTRAVSEARQAQRVLEVAEDALRMLQELEK